MKSNMAADIHDFTCLIGSLSISDSAPTIIASAMLLRVAGSNAHFKHQQRGEPDLTIADKQQIAAEILERKPVMFLARFGRYLVEEDLVYFKVRIVWAPNPVVLFIIRKCVLCAFNAFILRSSIYCN